MLDPSYLRVPDVRGPATTEATAACSAFPAPAVKIVCFTFGSSPPSPPGGGSTTCACEETFVESNVHARNNFFMHLVIIQAITHVEWEIVSIRVDVDNCLCNSGLVEYNWHCINNPHALCVCVTLGVIGMLLHLLLFYSRGCKGCPSSLAPTKTLDAACW